MTVARQIHNNSIVAGAGEVRLALRLPGGDYDGERYVGDSASLSLAVTRNVIDVQSGDGATPRTLKQIVTSTERSFSLTLNDTNIDNLALFFQADIGEQDNTNTAVTDEKLSVYPDRWYTLGQRAANPLGWGALKDLASTTITSDPSGTTYSLTTDADYVADEQVGNKDRSTHDILVDLKRGAFYISPYGDLKAAGPHKLLVDYTPAEPETKRQTFRSTTKAQEGAIRYTEQGTDGEPGQDIYARLCSVTASGESALKGRDSQRQIGLSLTVLKPDDGYPAIAGIQSMGSESYDD